MRYRLCSTKLLTGRRRHSFTVDKPHVREWIIDIRRRGASCRHLASIVIRYRKLNSVQRYRITTSNKR